jgi:hypothetical protein
MITVVVLLILAAFSVSAVLLSIKKRSGRDAGITDRTETAAEEARRAVEEHLEKTDSADLVAASPDAASHRSRTDAVKAGMRERIRDRLH